MEMYKYLKTLSRTERDHQIADHVKSLIFDMYSTAEVSMEEFMEDNANIQQVGLYYGTSDIGIEYIRSNGLKIDADKHDGVFGAAAHMAVRYISGTTKDLNQFIKDSNDVQIASTFEHFFMQLLKNFITRLDKGEALGEVLDELATKYPPQKEFLLE